MEVSLSEHLQGRMNNHTRTPKICCLKNLLLLGCSSPNLQLTLFPCQCSFIKAKLGRVLLWQTLPPNILELHFKFYWWQVEVVLLIWSRQQNLQPKMCLCSHHCCSGISTWGTNSPQTSHRWFWRPSPCWDTISQQAYWKLPKFTPAGTGFILTKGHKWGKKSSAKSLKSLNPG